MNNASPHRWLTITALSIAAMLTAYRETAVAQQQPMDNTDLSVELVDPNVLRVCADPHNLPFSNEQGEGFENKLDAMFAAKLGKRVGYSWFPQATGFVRNTLGAHRC